MTLTRIAIVGAGGVSKAHVAAVRELAGKVAISAVIEPRQEARDAFIQANAGSRGFDTVASFIAAGGKSIADALVLCTPPNVRLEIIRQAFEAGLPVLAEKPIASTLEDAKTLAALAKEHPNVPAAVGYCHRFAPAMIEMKRRADAGELGEVLRFENTFACWHPGMHASWMSDPQVSGGGSFIDTGCHSLDLFRYLIGNGTVGSAVYFDLWKGRGESNATVLLRSTSTATHKKCVGVIQSGWVEPARFDVRLTGTKASVYYDYEKATELVIVPSEGARGIVPVESHEVRFTKQLDAFSDLVSSRKPAVSPATFEDGLAISKLVDDAAGIRQII